MIVYYALGPLGLVVSAGGIWSLYNAWRYGRVRSHGWVKRAAEPKFFWFMVMTTFYAALWFGLVGVVVTADLIGLIR